MIVLADADAPLQSPLAVWEFIHRIVETLNKFFEQVSELDIMINVELVRPTTSGPRDRRLCQGSRRPR